MADRYWRWPISTFEMAETESALLKFVCVRFSELLLLFEGCREISSKVRFTPVRLRSHKTALLSGSGYGNEEQYYATKAQQCFDTPDGQKREAWPTRGRRRAAFAR